jgi:hypothetical protein
MITTIRTAPASNYIELEWVSLKYQPEEVKATTGRIEYHIINTNTFETDTS